MYVSEKFHNLTMNTAYLNCPWVTANLSRLRGLWPILIAERSEAIISENGGLILS